MSRAASNIHTEFTSDHTKVIQSLSASNKRLEEQVGKLRQVNRAGRGAESALTRLGKGAVLAGIGAVTATVGALKAALTQAEAAAEGAAARIRDTAGATKELLQISGGDTAANRRLQNIARMISAATGVSMQISEQVVQRGTSLGLSVDDMFQLMQARWFEEQPQELVTGVGRLRQMYNVQIAGLSSVDIINALLRGQQPTEVGAGALAQFLLKPGALAKELGGTFQEAVGLTGFATTAAAEPSEGVTQAEAFLTALIKSRRFEGMGILGGFEAFRAMTPAEQRAVIGGRKEAMIFGGRILDDAQFAELKALFAAIPAAIAEGGGGAYGRLLVAAEADPRIAASMLAGKQAARRAIAQERMGVDELVQDALVDAVMAEAESRGYGAPRRWATSALMHSLDWLGAGKELMAATGAAMLEPTGETGPGGVAAKLRELVPESLHNTEAMLDTLKSIDKGVQGLRSDGALRGATAVPAAFAE